MGFCIIKHRYIWLCFDFEWKLVRTMQVVFHKFSMCLAFYLGLTRKKQGELQLSVVGIRFFHGISHTKLDYLLLIVNEIVCTKQVVFHPPKSHNEFLALYNA